MLVKFGGGILDASGSVGGNVFSRNRYGNYVRSRIKPVNPNSPRQQEIRGILGGLVDEWLNSLTTDQRAAWNQYAANISWNNRLGESVKLSGFNHFTRANTLRLLNSLSIVEDGPTTYTLPGADETATATIASSTGKISVSFDNTAGWANEAEGFMAVQMSIPQSAGRAFLRPQWRMAGFINGSTPTPPTSPALLDVPWEVETGQVCMVRLRIVRADGRASMPFFRTVTIG